ncbi:MAG: hypothetical protein U0457_08625 [Candidatus Sericytochromatia bacterium]
MKNKVVSTFILASILFLNYQKPVQAESESIGLGGNKSGVNNAFVTMKSPANIMNSGGGNVILPLSPAINFNSDSLTINDFMSLGKNDNTTAIDKILALTKKSNGTINLESVVELPILGYTGTPFSLGERKIGFGVNLWTKAYIKTSLGLSKNFSTDMFNSLGSIGNIETTIANSSASLSSITSNAKLPDLSKYTSGTFNPFDKEQLKTAANDFESIQNSTIGPILTEGDKVIKDIEKVTTDIKNLLTTFNSLSGSKLLNGEIVTDGHAVLAVSGATSLFKNKMIDISAGVNLKAFIMPSFSLKDALGKDVPSNLISSLTAGTSKTPLVFTMDIQSDKFKSVDEINNILDNQVKGIIDNSKTLLDNTKTLNTKITSIIDKIKNDDLITAISESASLKTDFSSIESQAKGLQETAKTALTKETTDKIKNSLSDDLKTLKLNINSINDISPVGFGTDLSVQATIMNDIVVGLTLENPLVLWPAKSKKSIYGIEIPSQLSNNSKIDPSTFIKLLEDGAIQSTNYNMSEPMALRLGGAYNLSKLTSFLREAKVVAEIEQVFNGRPLAFNMGFEKNWNFGVGGVSLSLGTQLGGLSNMYSVGLGANLGMFNINAGYSASNLIDPINSKALAGGISTSLRF